ncbi:hypothetical protein RI367_002177 [Sorochytrium milnesiophthora]
MSKTLAECGLLDQLVRALGRLGVTTPTPAQTLLLPPLLQSSRDLLVRSSTGTGKTFGLLLGLFNKQEQEILDAAAFARTSRAHVIAPSGLLVVPHDDVAVQVAGWAHSIGREAFPDLRPAQLTLLSIRTRPHAVTAQSHPHLMIATPTMLAEHIARRELALNNLSTIVVDEADLVVPPLPRYNRAQRDLRLRKPKPGEQVMDTLMQSYKDVQQAKPRVILSSASLSAPMRQHAKKHGWVKHPLFVDRDKTSVLPSTITQYVYTVTGSGRVAMFTRDNGPDAPDAQQQQRSESDAALGKMLLFVRAFCRQHAVKHAIVFPPKGVGNTRVAELLSKSTDMSVSILHGDATLDEGHAEAELLVCSVLASRGLDFPTRFTHCFILGLPSSETDYLHLVGRTGRNGHSGTAVTVLDGTNASALRRMRLITAFIGGQHAATDGYRCAEIEEQMRSMESAD